MDEALGGAAVPVTTLDGSLDLVTLWLPKGLAIGVAAVVNVGYPHVGFRHTTAPAS